MSNMGMMPGPCISCGRTNYPLSMGGPGICPVCDCSPPSMQSIREMEERYESQLAALRAQVEALSGALRAFTLLRTDSVAFVRQFTFDVLEAQKLLASPPLAPLVARREAMERVILAAKNADWMQVLLNQGPPCFHLCDDGDFCLRAERWEGHKEHTGPLHQFVPLDRLLHAALASPALAPLVARRETY